MVGGRPMAKRTGRVEFKEAKIGFGVWLNGVCIRQ